MGKFARIIDVNEDQQVLLTVNFDNEEEVFSVEIRTDLSGFGIKMHVGFDTGEESIDFMNSFTQEQADEFVDSVIEKLLNDDSQCSS